MRLRDEGGRNDEVKGQKQERGLSVCPAGSQMQKVRGFKVREELDSHGGEPRMLN